MDMANPKTNSRRTFLEKLCFDFMADIVTIELGFGQQVAAEALKIFRNVENASLLESTLRAARSPQGNVNWRGGRQESLREMRSH